MQGPYQETIVEMLASRAKIREPIRIRVTSQSMAPLINTGDMILVESVPVQEIACGEIVIFKNGSDLLTHRLVSKKGDSLITKGDANLFPDGRLSSQEVIGWVTAIERKARIIDLRKLRWRIGNRLIARISLIEGNFFLWMKRKKEKQGKENLGRVIPLTMRLFSFPFKILVRLIAI